jgi:hypothetical protein
MLVIIALGPISKTIELYNENKALEAQVLMAKRAPEELVFYRHEAQALQKVIHFNESDIDLKEDILTNAAAACALNNSMLINLQAPAQHTESDFRIETYEVILKGDYINLLRDLVYLENHLQSGKVVSVRFMMEKNDTGKHLMAHIFVQTSKGRI